ncbi:MAG TPA: MlaD family protein [Longimicrobiaceae bacterium]|nr:MlaD family protein [Longimicrobiaceae bacterium]
MRLKNEVVVGIVVVAGLAVLAIGGYWLTGRPWGQEQREITAAFREVGLLGEGSPVKYRGVTVGRVERIMLAPRGDGVIVDMTVEPGVLFPADAAVVLSAESFFGDWQAAIVSRRTLPELEFYTTTQAGVLPGAALPDITQLTAVAARIASDIELLSDRVQLAFTEETAIGIRETIDNIRKMSEQLDGFVDQQTGTYAGVSRNVLEATANIRDATATAEQVANEFGGAVNRGDVQAVLANARVASDNLRLFSEQLNTAGAGVPGLISRADTTLGSLGGLVRSLQPQVAEVGPTIVEARQAIATLQRAAARIEEGQGTLGRLMEDPALYEETQRAVATLRRLLADVQANPAKYIGQLKLF